jgi:hypothetical protein
MDCVPFGRLKPRMNTAQSSMLANHDAPRHVISPHDVVCKMPTAQAIN